MNILPLATSILIMLFSNSIQNEKILFDGVSLDKWEIIDFEGHGEVTVIDSSIIIGMGDLISGIRWTADFPKTNYEVNLEAKRVAGKDFFCGLTFPVKESYLTLVVGGWGGMLSGLSCIDGYDAANNGTGIVFPLGSGWWYPVRLKVTDEKIEAWVDNEKIVDFTINKSELSLRWEVESSIPFGITTYKTTGAIRRIRVRTISQ